MVIPPCWPISADSAAATVLPREASGVESLYRTTGLAHSESSIGERPHVTKHFVHCGQQVQGDG